MQFDPGKPLLYHLLLHWFCGWFGTSEAALRGLSLIFGISSTALVFAYGNELFGPRVGFAAAAIWAFNPLALLFARWARMYSMFVAFALAHLLALAKVRRRPTAGRSIAAGVLGAAMLYSHLAAVLIIGADLMVVMRELRRDRRSASWPAVAIAVLLFAPFIPAAAAQTRELLFGHWLDWIGVHRSSAAMRVLTAGLAAGVLLWLSLGLRRTSELVESVLRCSLYAGVPLLVFAAGSIVLRPMFVVRYVAPSFAVAAVILAWGLDRMGARVRNDSVLALTVFFAMLLPLSYTALDQPWREIAARVAAGDSPRQTVFFETGFFSAQHMIDQNENNGFPLGFFRAPFMYYFKQHNPDGAVPGDDPQRARQLIRHAALKAGGAWLVSGKPRPEAVAELPSGATFQVDVRQDFSRVLLLHIRVAGREPPHPAAPVGK
jgi:uncharacterized membrane protein